MNRESPASLPPGVVTRTSTAPAACGGVTARILVGLRTVKLAAAVPPKLTAVASVRLLPEMRTAVPPDVGPLFGDTAATVGPPMKVKPPTPVPDPPLFVTTTSTVPAACAGVVATIEVALFTVKLAAAVPPKVTDLTPMKLLPVTMTVVPPDAGPLSGETDVTVGAGGT